MKVALTLVLFLAVSLAGCISDGDDDEDFDITCPQWPLARGLKPAIWNWIHDPMADPETSDFANRDESTMYIYRPTNAGGHNVDGDITDFYQLDLTVGAIHNNTGMQGELIDTRLEIVAYVATDEPNRINKSQEIPAPKGRQLLFHPLTPGEPPQARLIFTPGERVSNVLYQIRSREPGEPMDPIDLRMDVHMFGDQDGDPETPSVGAVQFTLSRWHLREACQP